MMADWFKVRRLDPVVAAVKKSPLMKFVLGGGPPFGELSSELSDALYAHFRSEVEELEAELCRDLSAWKRPPRANQGLIKLDGPEKEPHSNEAKVADLNVARQK
jgi:hypothetical protein